jgi:hypothetical protein
MPHNSFTRDSMSEELKSKDKVASTIDVKTHHLLVTIASYKWILLLTSICIFVFSVYLLKYRFVYYSSTVSFIVNDIPAAEEDRSNTSGSG